MKKIIALTFLTLLFSCKPIIFTYKPIAESDLVKEGEFYYLTTTNGKIGWHHDQYQAWKSLPNFSKNIFNNPYWSFTRNIDYKDYGFNLINYLP